RSSYRHEACAHKTMLSRAQARDLAQTRGLTQASLCNQIPNVGSLTVCPVRDDARMSAVVIIPARWASTRFPGKPLYEIAGKPLLQHVWEGGRRPRKFDPRTMATDAMRLAGAPSPWAAEVASPSPNLKIGTNRTPEVAKRWNKLWL